MASIESVRASIDANVKTNGQQKITGSVLNYVLNGMVDLSEQAEKEIRSQGIQIQSLEQGKANEDGKYPQLTAGFANNLVGRGEAIEAEIDFRPSGGKSIEDGAARVKELWGNTIVKDGEFLSCKATGIKSVNDNAWDEQWEKGYINNTNGYEQDSEYYIRSKNYNRILAGETYYLKGDNSYILLYDENKQYLDYWGMPTEGRTIVVDSRARYFKIAFAEVYGTKYKDNVIVSLYHSGYKEGQYIPHKEFIREFDSRIKEAFPNGMQIGDKVYNKNGKGYIIKATSVMANLANLDWSYISGDGRFSAYVTGFASPTSVTEKGNIVCSKYSTLSALDTYNGITGISIDNGRIWLRDNSLNGNVSLLESNLQNVQLYYEVADPEILEFENPFNLDYEVWDFGTEEMIASEPSAPIRGLIAYGFNAVDEIRELRQMLTTLQTQIANL